MQDCQSKGAAKARIRRNERLKHRSCRIPRPAQERTNVQHFETDSPHVLPSNLPSLAESHTLVEEHSNSNEWAPKDDLLELSQDALSAATLHDRQVDQDELK